jgi:hypothetical protein
VRGGDHARRQAVRRLNPKAFRVIEEIEYDLAETLAAEDSPWPDVLEFAMSQAWDALAKLEPIEDGS